MSRKATSGHAATSLFNRKHLKQVVRKKPGGVPGTPVHTGAKRVEDIQMIVHDFDEDFYEAIPITKIEKSEPYLTSKSKTWIQVNGLHDVDKLKSVWEYFSLHPLVQEDIVSTTQRPKTELYPDHMYMVLRLITDKQTADGPVDLHTEQISIVLGTNYVLSFQETDEPVFAPILKRLEMSTTRLRRYGTDYLAYALIDAVVDHYFNALDHIGESIEQTEDLIISGDTDRQIQRIHSLRHDLVFFRKSVWSLRDALNSLIRDDVPLISPEVKLFIRDVYDHASQAIDSIETNREMVSGLYEMYMSTLSNRMNEVMKVLTMIATIFIPLTFIAGIYGMNFNTDMSPYNMPELNWQYGYPFSIALMAAVTLGLIYFFRRKKWL
ncbi:magnesium/cobalt transporter CorA [Rhodohalobacter mucosus]|uniref:Magnesium transport protein CorA n=1 Tax=Rhodohalobacter mucosus TaxID=2079485 RepID=A0A316TX31_9BACT|nr:magnesium/cobalt transporter CorA [Rhodohalobacter mucosus]PWN07134.1 magnesium and cobalt transport protein CorA [Rhodohalobacter mucosus]